MAYPLGQPRVPRRRFAPPPASPYQTKLQSLRQRRLRVLQRARLAEEMQLEGLGIKLRKVLRPLKKIAAVAVAPILAPTAALVAPKLVPKLLQKARVIGAKRAAQLTKIGRTFQKIAVPAAIAGAAFLIPGLGATTLTALKGAGGFLSQFGGPILSTVQRLPEFLGMTAGEQQQAEAAISAGQPPPANLPGEFLEAYMRTVTSQAQQHPEAVRPAAAPEAAPAEAPAVEAGMAAGMGPGTGTMIALGAAGLLATMAFGGGGRRR